MMVKENLLCLFGGITGSEDQIRPNSYLNDLYLLNLSEKYWSVPIVGGYVPTPRYHFSFGGNQNETYGEVLVLGGRVQDGSVDQCAYILHELDMDSREAWDERNDDEKNQFASYRDAVKKDKKQNFPTLNLEFNEAEKIILDQKRLMGEKEKEFKKIQGDQIAYQQQQSVAQARIDESKQILDQKLVKIRLEIDQKNLKASEDQDLINKVKMLLAFERKKRKIYQRKALCLQDAFRKAENFIITMDQFYCKGLKDDAFSGNVNEDYLIKIEKMKQEHRGVLTSFRNEFEECFKREHHVRAELKAKKEVLKPFEQISQIYGKTLTKEECEYLGRQR